MKIRPFSPRDQHFFAIGFLLILASNTLFAVYVAPWYSLSGFWGTFWIIVGGILCITTLGFQIVTNVLDPGYLPIGTDPDPKEETIYPQGVKEEIPPLQLLNSESGQFGSNTTVDKQDPQAPSTLDNRKPQVSIHILGSESNLPSNYPFVFQNTSDPYTRQVFVGDRAVNVKYCVTCNTWRFGLILTLGLLELHIVRIVIDACRIMTITVLGWYFPINNRQIALARRITGFFSGF